MDFIALHARGFVWYVETSHISALKDWGDSTDVYLTGDGNPIKVDEQVEDILKLLNFEV